MITGGHKWAVVSSSSTRKQWILSSQKSMYSVKTLLRIQGFCLSSISYKSNSNPQARIKDSRYVCIFSPSRFLTFSFKQKKKKYIYIFRVYALRKINRRHILNELLTFLIVLNHFWRPTCIDVKFLCLLISCGEMSYCNMRHLLIFIITEDIDNEGR